MEQLLEYVTDRDVPMPQSEGYGFCVFDVAGWVNQAEAWKNFLDDLDDKINKQKRFSLQPP